MHDSVFYMFVFVCLCVRACGVGLMHPCVSMSARV